jgi:peptidoglycan/xylan/chitin deacetylase (PgdA/CDA1 family)
VGKPLGVCVTVLLTLAPAARSQPAAFDPAKVVIVKADDFKVPNQGWTDFLTSSRALGVKVGLGVITANISGNAATARWMRDQQAVGDVEFWNHGWDHSTWSAGGTTFWEFKNSGLVFQQNHFSDAQAGLLNATGRHAMAFGTPYNQYDADTVAIMNATPALRLFFTHNISSVRTAGLSGRVEAVRIISESGGTGKPIAASFIAANPGGPAGPVSLQFHPVAFTAADLTEYVQILQFLLNHGYTFMLPAEFVAALDAATSITAWRQFHFGNPNNSGSAADSQDPDGDGITNAREYVLGTVPTQPDSGPPLVAASAGQGITLTFVARQAEGAGYAGLTRRYTVESTADLASPVLWEAMTGHSNILGENQTVTLTPSTDGNRWFFRLRVTLE